MKSNKGGVGVVLDISKAFDAVPHQAIEHAFRRKGIPSPITELVLESNRILFTRISHKDGNIEVVLQRDVKKGDPLSPLLFNIVMEPLLERLEAMPGYDLRGGFNISTLALADDLVLPAAGP